MAARSRLASSRLRSVYQLIPSSAFSIRLGDRTFAERATAELGQLGVQRIIDTSVTAIRGYIQERDQRATTTNRK